LVHAKPKYQPAAHQNPHANPSSASSPTVVIEPDGSRTKGLAQPTNAQARNPFGSNKGRLGLSAIFLIAHSFCPLPKGGSTHHPARPFA
jgi:hypothetical protein